MHVVVQVVLLLRVLVFLLSLQEVLDWFSERKLHAYSISAGQSLLYNDIFPKHKERLGKKMSELVVSHTARLCCG